MAATRAAASPRFVQNRCYARLGWDRDVRAFCREREHRLSGLLAADREPPRCWPPAGHRRSPRATGATPAQVVFRFALEVGMLPLTGTTDAAHMREDLASPAVSLSADEVRAIESLAG